MELVSWQQEAGRLAIQGACPLARQPRLLFAYRGGGLRSVRQSVDRAFHPGFLVYLPTGEDRILVVRAVKGK